MARTKSTRGSFSFAEFFWSFVVIGGGIAAAIARDASIRENAIKEERARQQRSSPAVETRGTYR
jgi:hypothetical protein